MVGKTKEIHATTYTENIYAGKSTLAKVFIWIWSAIGAIVFFIIGLLIILGEFLLEILFNVVNSVEGLILIAVIIGGLVALGIVSWVFFKSGRFVKHAVEHGFMNAVTGNVKEEDDEHIFDAGTLARIETMKRKRVNYGRRIKKRRATRANGIVYSCRKINNIALRVFDRAFNIDDPNTSVYRVYVMLDGIENFLRGDVEIRNENTAYSKGDKVTIEYDRVKPAACRILEFWGEG